MHKTTTATMENGPRLHRQALPGHRSAQQGRMVRVANTRLNMLPQAQ
jgi:hypothetical protein